jgi:hypothetical protein
VAEDDVGGRDLELAAQQIEHVEGRGAELEVHGDRRPGCVVRLGGGGHRPPGVLVEVVILAGDLDQAGACIGVGHRAGQLVDEHLRQARIEVLELARVVVRRLVQAGRGDDVEAGRAGEVDQRPRPATHAEWRPLHHRAPAEPGEGPELSTSRLRIIDLLAREQRGAEEQVVVRVGNTEPCRREVAQDAADYHCGPAFRSSNCGDERCSTS